MPTYEYRCTKCDRAFELFQSIKAGPRRFITTECEQCHNRAPVRRCISAGAGVIFKGSGFYATDYRSDGYAKAAKADKEAAEGKTSKDKKDKKSGTKTTGKTPGGSTSSDGTAPSKRSGRSGSDKAK